MAGQQAAPMETDAAAPQYQYKLVVIGGGSGGLACSKQAAKHLGEKKVAVLDFVTPSEGPLGTTWGLGGTCVNVGCIPKKLMHTAGLLGEGLHDAAEYGWDVPENVQHNWGKMVTGVNNHIKSLNFGYRGALRTANVEYINALGEFKDPHTILCTDKQGKTRELTSENFVIAVGGRPRFPDIPGAREFCISSDDLFWLKKSPGKSLVVGASYVALECAGFLAALGLDTTVAVRSIFLRGFDQEFANLIVDYMREHKTKFLMQTLPAKVEKQEDGRLLVTFDNGTSDVFDTVLFAIGRDPCTARLRLDNAGVQVHASGKIHAPNETTNVPHIYAIGDVLLDRPELTPVAIAAGRRLADRLFGPPPHYFMDYSNIPTTVFTPIEYGCIGLSQEAAQVQHGPNLEVVTQQFTPLEWTVSHKESEQCRCKLLINKADNERVVGFHYLGPNAGEVTQGFTTAMRLGATKTDFLMTVGIHPTTAETFTTMDGSEKAAGC